MKYPIHNQNGEKIGETELNPKIFELKPKESVIHQIVTAQLANRRKPWAHTKQRSEIRGGGRKPWRQKGTGRARHGSIRSPLWIGGGVTFGPRKERNYNQKVNKKMKRKALAMCLSDLVQNKHLILLDKIKLTKIKTKNIIDILKNLKLTNKKVLLSLDKKDEKVILSARNIQGLNFIAADSLNCLDILNNECLVITVKGLEKYQTLLPDKTKLSV